MLVESIAFVVIGLLVAAVALTALPEYFRTPRGLTVGTAVVAALLSGVIAHYALDGRPAPVILAISATGSALLVSVLARPDRVTHAHRAHRARRPGGRRRPHRHA
ncbi:hypothetical protein [Kitasatospora sp. NBC_00315]|uniref:hypothetical protein n=1 Tax=Kitasatospora sp. NBC_00315 TaxID=2975963 RepID=UPI00324DB541